jgi:hypothetical protein
MHCECEENVDRKEMERKWRVRKNVQMTEEMEDEGKDDVETSDTKADEKLGMAGLYIQKALDQVIQIYPEVFGSRR